MSYPGAYPPGSAGQGQSAIIAAPLGDPLAEAIAAGLRNLGWQVVVTDQFGPYAREARVCVVPLTPMTINGPSVSAALANPPAALIPLVVGATPLPPGPWATAPVIFSGEPTRTAQDIAQVAGGVGGMGGATAPSGYGQPPKGPAMMGGYAAPSTPLAPSNFPPSQPYQQQPTAAMPYATGPAPMGQPAQAGYQPQPGYAPQYPSGGAPYGQPAPQAPKRRIWPWIVGGVLIVVILLCSIGGFALYQVGAQATAKVSATLTAQANQPTETPTPLATPTSSIPANFTQYSDSSNGYSMAYPTSWNKSASGELLTLSDTGGVAALIVGAIGATIPQSDINTQLNGFFTGMAGSGSVSNVKGPVSVTVAGVTWTQKSADVTRSGSTVHSVVLAVNHGSRFYIIGYLAEESQFQTLNTTDFQPMLQTFTFTS